MEQVYQKARGKINLTLQVLEKREDGYHNLKSIFQIINLYDELWISKTDTNTIEIEMSHFDLPLEQNIIYKAYQKLREQYKIGGVKVKMVKNIPTQAGLGGGSSDCAAFLKGINRLFGLNLNTQELQAIGVAIGADVPGCLQKGAFLAEGIGEKITLFESKTKYYLVIVKPQISFHTGKMYQAIDEAGVYGAGEYTESMSQALKTGDIKSLCANLYNSFEEVVKDNLELETVKKMLKENGAKGAMLSGSGSCVFGVFEEREQATKAYRTIKKEKEAYLCLPYNVIKEEKRKHAS